MIFISNKDAAQRAVIPRWSSGGRALRIVIDASVVLKWIPGHDEEAVLEAREVYKMMMGDKLEIFAPTFLLIEVLNILTLKRKAKYSLVKKNIELLSQGKIKFIGLDVSDLPQIEEIVHKYGLTAYDAIYLNLARAKTCKLLTADKKLLKIKNLTVGIEEILNG